MNGRFRFPIYVFLFALFPVLSLLAANINEMALVEGLRALIFAEMGAGLLLLVVGFRGRQWRRAGLVVSLLVVGFLSYGHFYKLFLDVTGLGNTIGVYAAASAVWLLLLATLALFIWRRVTRPDRFTGNLTIMSLAVLLLPVFTVISTLVGGNSAVAESALTASPGLEQPVSARPDIYYIILDGYGRADVLSAVYGFDNRLFIEALAGRGFFVADSSRTNYINTIASLASSLNMDYLDGLAAEVGADSDNLLPLRNRVENNGVQSFLDSLGYETITISSGYNNTEARRADHYLTNSFRGINNFETLLIQHTPIGRYIVRPGYLLADGLQFAPHRDRIAFSFDSLGESAPAFDSPKFVFAHIVAPHPPFVFGPNGEAVQPDYAFTLSDGSHFPGTTESYLEGYRNQLVYMNKRILAVVDQILAASDTQPIIVIQSDHGPGAFLDWRGPEHNSCLKERAANFIAVLTPDGQAEFYDSISPVNIFRLLFNHYFDMDLALLADKTFFTIPARPYGYIEITGQIEGSAACLSG